MCLLYASPFYVCEHYICMYLSYCVICLILHYRSLLICTNKEFMKKIEIHDNKIGSIIKIHTTNQCYLIQLQRKVT